MLSSGKRSIVFSSHQAVLAGEFNLPCGDCIGCRLEHARQWAMRCMDEASLYKSNSFITLTFNDKSLPLNRSLDVSHFQNFMKRLRTNAVRAGRDLKKDPIRYFHCGEYGPLNSRPHYHALLFNVGFPDRVFLKKTKSGESIYSSKILASNWDLGYSSVGDVTFGSAAYVARYHVKKVGSVVSDNHYLNKQTGEMLSPEYVTMSRRPGIGKSWYQKFKLDMYPSDFRIIDGMKVKPARYYDSLHENENSSSMLAIRRNRCRSFNPLDSTPDRLAVREYCKTAQVKLLSHKLEEI